LVEQSTQKNDKCREKFTLAPTGRVSFSFMTLSKRDLLFGSRLERPRPGSAGTRRRLGESLSYYPASLQWSPGPRPSPAFRSAICDCLSFNVSISLFLSHETEQSGTFVRVKLGGMRNRRRAVVTWGGELRWRLRQQARTSSSEPEATCGAWSLWRGRLPVRSI
jgi:hypothetical protein